MTYSNYNEIKSDINSKMSKAIDVLNKCMEKGLSRMRNFQRQLVTEGMSLVAYPFSKILDVDHVEDIMKAEKFLNQK